jgi:hypothetical protein
MPDYRADIIGQDGHFQKSVPLEWIEILTCSRCGKTGLAELWDSPAFEGHADLVPPGFKAVHHMQGRTFYCVDCDLPARSEPR